MEHIFEAGFREFLKLKRQGGWTSASSWTARAAPCARPTSARLDALESHLSFLASVGSVSPYVGLFGTVWGIMNAFRGLSNVAQATLAQVAPGIAEALIATAMGLFAAIPAVIAYNRYRPRHRPPGDRFESFMEEFSNILQRQPNATCEEAVDRATPLHEPDQRRAVHRRDAGAAGHFHVTAPLINPGQIELPSVGQSLKPPVAPLEVEIRKPTTACTCATWTRSNTSAQSQPGRTGRGGQGAAGAQSRAGGGDLGGQERALRGGAEGDGHAAEQSGEKSRAAGQAQGGMMPPAERTRSRAGSGRSRWLSWCI